MGLNKKANMMDGFDVVRSLAQAREAAARSVAGQQPAAAGGVRAGT